MCHWKLAFRPKKFPVHKAMQFIPKPIAGRQYFHLTIADNGIGFEPQYNEQIFEVFKRLHGREIYEGSGHWPGPLPPDCEQSSRRLVRRVGDWERLRVSYCVACCAGRAGAVGAGFTPAHGTHSPLPADAYFSGQPQGIAPTPAHCNQHEKYPRSSIHPPCASP